MTVSIRIGGVAAVEAIRAQFPALTRRHLGQPVAYFDGPGGTQVPTAVVAAMNDYLFHHNANTHWHYPSSAETDELLEAARAALADFLNARPDEIAFGLNMTTLTYHLSRALGREWSAGDEVIVTELDHHGNVAPWQALARERGIVLRTLPLRVENGTLDLNQLPSLLGPRTRLLAIGAASNSLGTVVDTAAACALARQAGVLSFVDAVHGAPHLLLDVQALGCDFLAGSAYKFYGPHVGFLFGRKERIEALDLPKLIPAPDTAPERLETGTQNHEGIVGAGAAVDFLAGLGHGSTRRGSLAVCYSELHRRSAALFRRLWDGLAAHRRVRLYGPPPDAPRTPTLAFTVNGMAAATVAERLAERAVFVSHGDFYALTVVERLGLVEDGLVRAGCACYTTEAEIDRLISGVAQLFPG
ncbi:MAG TPA: cysteine desulfurase-like protein [Gemmatimonadales bacterium]|nr:cysteine desulfurase-like protein [Gemmatimonadales bacterium]